MNNVIIFPNTLFESNDLINNKTNVFIVEHSVFFSMYKYHKLKLILHRSTMKYYADYLKKRYKCNITYINHHIKNAPFELILKKLKGQEIHYYDPVDHYVGDYMNKIGRKYKLQLNPHDSPLFMNKSQEYFDYANSNNNLRHDEFYKWQRRKHDILMIKDKPTGGKWSYDTQNRESFPKNFKEGYNPKKTSNKYIIEAKNYINENFKNNMGLTDFYLPIDFDGAKRHLRYFFRDRYKCYGPYQDAVDENVDYGCHSFISPLINIGMLTPKYVIKTAEDQGKKYKVPIQSVEGFIRQILGWREYVYMLYITKRSEFEKKNHYKHKRTLGAVWFEGTEKSNDTTGFDVLDDLIDKMIRIGYLHHIERLMYIGNWFLINGIKPEDGFEWFMIGFMDAYHWVMYANVYGMSLHSAGPIMMTRPYFSSSSYIDRMSSYKKRKDEYDKIKLGGTEYEWFDVWDAIYYNFISENTNEFKKNYAIARQVNHWDKKSASEKKRLKNIASEYNKYY